MDSFPHFQKFASVFHQDFGLVYPSLDAAIATGLNYVGRDGHAELLREIESLLLLSRKELRAVWRRSPSEIYFFKAAELEHFVRMVRDRLAATASK